MLWGKSPVSKRVTCVAPDTPATILCQKVSTSLPIWGNRPHPCNKDSCHFAFSLLDLDGVTNTLGRIIWSCPQGVVARYIWLRFVLYLPYACTNRAKRAPFDDFSGTGDINFSYYNTMSREKS